MTGSTAVVGTVRRGNPFASTQCQRGVPTQPYRGSHETHPSARGWRGRDGDHRERAARRRRARRRPSRAARVYYSGDRFDGSPRAALGINTSSTGTLRDTLGLLVSSVMRGGPAEKAGLEEGNRIASINGVNLRSNEGRPRGLRERGNAESPSRARAREGEAGRRSGAARVSRGPHPGAEGAHRQLRFALPAGGRFVASRARTSMSVRRSASGWGARAAGATRSACS